MLLPILLGLCPHVPLTCPPTVSGSTLPTAAAAQTLDDLVGQWSGGYAQAAEHVMIDLIVERKGRGLKARVALPERGFRMDAEVELSGRQVSWTVTDDDGEVRAAFTGQLDGAWLRGSVRGSTIERTGCNLVRVTPLDEATRERYAGTYRVDEETSLRIVRVPLSLGDALGIEFPAEGLRSLLYATSPTELIAGQGELPLPVEARCTFHLDDGGEVESLELVHGDMALVATPTDDPRATAALELPTIVPGFTEERRAVRIPAGDVELAGTLYFPPGVERPVPAVVQLHGSAPTRHVQQWFYFTSTALESGMAVLAFDKRGCGESTGRYRSFTVSNSAGLFDELSDDGAACVEWLARQEGIDPERIGLIGGSQAGWIMPLVAKKAQQVRFIISGCGPPVSAGEENEHARLLGTGMDLAEADRLLEAYDGPRGYDPRQLLRRLETPILWLFGERDDVIPTRACLAEMAKLRAEGHLQHDVHVFPDADHSFQTSRGDGVLLSPVIVRWLEQREILR